MGNSAKATTEDREEHRELVDWDFYDASDPGLC